MQPRNVTTIGRAVGQDQSALRRSLLIGTALALLWSGPALARNAPPGDDETIDESETTAATTEDETGEIIIVSGLAAGIEHSLKAQQNSINQIGRENVRTPVTTVQPANRLPLSHTKTRKP